MGQGGGAEVEEEGDRVVEEEGDLTCCLEPGGQGEESRCVDEIINSLCLQFLKYQSSNLTCHSLNHLVMT